MTSLLTVLVVAMAAMWLGKWRHNKKETNPHSEPPRYKRSALNLMKFEYQQDPRPTAPGDFALAAREGRPFQNLMFFHRNFKSSSRICEHVYTAVTRLKGPCRI